MPRRDRRRKSCSCRTARRIARDKPDLRLNVAVARVTESGLPLVYLNQVGGQDELVFDGASFVLNADRSLARSCRPSRRAVATLRWTQGADGWRCAPGRSRRWSRATRPTTRACVLGLRDYVDKNGFPGVVLGLSGGIDSALCAAIAVDALGADRVRGVMLPYRFTSQESLDDAAKLRQGARHPLRHAADRGARSKGFEQDRCAGCSPGCRATSPRRTCRPRARHAS